MANGKKGHSEEDGLSTALRLLMHYVGDIHQPLHATSRVDHEYNSGDRGGNSFPLPVKDSVKNLHALWDSVLYEFTGYETLVSQLNKFYRRDLCKKKPISFSSKLILKVYKLECLKFYFYKTITNFFIFSHSRNKTGIQMVIMLLN